MSTSLALSIGVASALLNGGGFSITNLKNLQINLQAYNANDLTLDDGHKCSVWENKGLSGSSLNAAMATPANMPTYRGDGLEFDSDNSTRFNIGTSGDINYLHDGTGTSAYLVSKVTPKGADEQGGLFGNSSNGVLPGVFVEYNDNSGIGADHNIRIAMGNGSSVIVNDYLQSNLYTDNEMFIFNYRDSTANDMRVDIDNGEYTKDITPSGTRSSSNSSNLELGKYGAQYMNGHIYRFLVFDRYLTDVEHEKVLLALENEYNFQYAINALSKVKLFVHADFGLEYDDQGFVTSWRDIVTQDEAKFQYSAARRISSGYQSKPAVRLGGDVLVPLHINSGTDIFIEGDLDNNIIRSMIVAEDLTEQEKTSINRYIQKIS